MIGLGGNKIRSPDQVKRLMKKAQDITKQYSVCKNGCYLFGDDEESAVCPNQQCNEDRFKAGSRVPQQEMTCVSIGAALANMLYDEETRDLFTYKSDCDSSNEDESFNDIFSGQSYKELYTSGVIKSSDICLVIYVDGYAHKNKKNHSFTMIHSIIMNLDPSIR